MNGSFVAFPSTHAPETFAEFWPHWQPVATAVVADYSAAHEWERGRSASIVVTAYTDGPWQVVVDRSLSMISDHQSLSDLSRSVGVVVVAATLSSAAAASFRLYRNGTLMRSIDYGEHSNAASGDAIDEEEDVDTAALTIDELCKLWRNFGLSGFGGNAATESMTCFEFQESDGTMDPGHTPRRERKKRWRFW